MFFVPHADFTTVMGSFGEAFAKRINDYMYEVRDRYPWLAKAITKLGKSVA